jgi:hypothetical protein
MATVSYTQFRNSALNLSNGQIELAGNILSLNDYLDCDEIGKVPVEELAQATRRYTELTDGNCRPQLAALVFDVIGDFRALDFYFPITNSLQADPNTHQDFYTGIRYIAHHPSFDLQVIGSHRQNVTAHTPPAVQAILAGHLAEVFFYRRDILERFLAQPRHFQLYTNRDAFQQDGGLAGGDYSFDREAIQLELSRLFEGFFGATPGVAPFLHELGHMLDHFEAGTGAMGQCEGILPGMSVHDGQIFTPQARQLFIEGKRIEQQRYQVYQNGKATPGAPVPIGHPYVFQTDGEFIAGYLEMFFRNPNYFATQNPILYQAFATALAQDPRRDWPQDFGFYVDENRKAFLGHQRPTPQHITIPNEQE